MPCCTLTPPTAAAAFRSRVRASAGRLRVRRRRGGLLPVYSVALALLLGLAALAALLGLAASAVLSGAASLTSDVFMVVFGCLLAAGAVGLHVYVSAWRENYAWSRTRIGDDRFRLDLELGTLYRIHLANAILIALTLGLAIPWAKARLSRLCLLAACDLSRHVAQEREQMAALGEELGDALDLDLGL